VITAINGQGVSSPTALTSLLLTKNLARRSKSCTSTSPARVTRLPSRSVAARLSEASKSVQPRRNGLERADDSICELDKQGLEPARIQFGPGQARGGPAAGAESPSV